MGPRKQGSRPGISPSLLGEDVGRARAFKATEATRRLAPGSAYEELNYRQIVRNARPKPPSGGGDHMDSNARRAEHSPDVRKKGSYLPHVLEDIGRKDDVEGVVGERNAEAVIVLYRKHESPAEVA
jgi:hypothetical protein